MKLAERVNRIKPSPTLSVTAKANALRAEGKNIISFGAGEPDFDTPLNVKNAGINAIKDGFTKYTPVAGIDELKDAIIDKLQRDNQLTYNRSQVVVSCGAKHTLYNLAQVLFEKGDEVIIPAPYWVSYPDIVLLSDATPVILETKESEGFKINPIQLERAITENTKAIILNSPSNPVGVVYSFSELEGLADVIVRTGILAISDDIYEKIIYDGFSFFNIAGARKEMKDLTVVVNGVSKAYAMTGWRIGYAAGPEEIISAVSKIQSQSTSNPVSISQKAAVEAFTGDQGATGKMVVEYKKRRDYIVENLSGIKDISCINPQGAFYVFPNVSLLYGSLYKGRKISNSFDLTEYLLDEANVVLVPGAPFGNDDHIRISYATSMENIKEGIKRIKKAIDNLEK